MTGQALWAYCVLAAPEAVALPELQGVERGSRVECVVDGGLAALVSHVPLADYDDDRLREHLNDIAWVERIARAHEHVLEQLLADHTIVPLRLCTLFRDHDGVRRLLREQRAELSASLRMLAGRREWGLKLFADPTRVRTTLIGSGAEGATTSGADYLARKQRERDAGAAAGELVARYAEDAHERLASVADAARVNPVQRPEAHGHPGDMVLNGVYLVDRSRETELVRALEDLRSEWADEGLDLELTGPWPGYNFASDWDPLTP